MTSIASPQPGSSTGYSVVVSPGDVILFSRNCGRMTPFPALLCYSAKIGAWSEWDHAGIVVPMNADPKAADPSSAGRLGLLEINIGGVTLRPLAQRIARSSSHRIAVRKLVAPPASAAGAARETATMEQRLRRAAARLLPMQYNESSFSLSNSMLQSHLSHAQRNRNALLDMASIDRDMSDASAELSAHGIIGESLGEGSTRIDVGSTAPLLQLWADRYMHALIDHRRVDIKAVEAHYATGEPAPYEGKRVVEHYFCSDLVADVLHNCGVLHSAVRDRTHMLLPADLSSTASLPGMSLYMNSNSNNKIPSAANCTLHYAMSPDIVFDKKNVEITEGTDGAFSLRLRSEGASADTVRSSSTTLTIKFAPGDVLPLGWISGVGPGVDREIFELDLLDGSAELLAPGSTYSNTPSTTDSHPEDSSSDFGGLFRIARLSTEAGHSKRIRYIKGNVNSSLDTAAATNGDSATVTKSTQSLGATGWFFAEDKVNSGWVWCGSNACRLRAGRNGATVSVNIKDLGSTVFSAGGIDVAGSSDCKLMDKFSFDDERDLFNAVRLLLPHPSVANTKVHRSKKQFVDEIVNSLRPHASVITVKAASTDINPRLGESKTTTHKIGMHRGSDGRMEPSPPILVLTEGELTLRRRDDNILPENGQVPLIHNSVLFSENKSDIVGRLVVRGHAEDNSKALSKGETVKVPTCTVSKGVCIIDAETLLSPTVSQTTLGNRKAGGGFHWVPEKPCRFLVLDRSTCARAGLAYGYGISDMMHITSSSSCYFEQEAPEISIVDEANHIRSTTEATHDVVEVLLKDRWGKPAISGVAKSHERLDPPTAPAYGGYITTFIKPDGKRSSNQISRIDRGLKGEARHYLMASTRPDIIYPSWYKEQIRPGMESANRNRDLSFSINRNEGMSRPDDQHGHFLSFFYDGATIGRAIAKISTKIF